MSQQESTYLGNVQILEACRAMGIGRYIYASTVYVYSRDGGFYRCSKQAAEHYVEECNQRSYGLDYTILRYGSALWSTLPDHRNGSPWRTVKNTLETGTLTYEGSPRVFFAGIHSRRGCGQRQVLMLLRKEFCNEHTLCRLDTNQCECWICWRCSE